MFTLSFPEGAAVELQTREAAASFFRDEAARWVDLNEKAGQVGQQVSGFAALMKAHITFWKGLASTFSAAPVEGDEKTLRQAFSAAQSSILKRDRLYSGGRIASRSFALVSHEPKVACHLILIAVGRYFAENVAAATPVMWSDFGHAMALLADPETASEVLERQRETLNGIAADKAALTSFLEDGSKSIDALKQRELSTFESLDEAFGQSQAERDREAELQRDKVEDDWKKLRSAYDAELKLRAPRYYWRTKHNEHGRLAQVWSKRFIRTALGSVAVLFALLYYFTLIAGSLTTLGSYGWIVPAIILAMPAFLGLWLLRFIGRNWSDHLIRVEDARERLAMIETFLALSRDTDSPNAMEDKAQVGLVLAAIFRPGPGLTTDDSPPAGFLEALLNRVNASPAVPPRGGG